MLDLKPPLDEATLVDFGTPYQDEYGPLLDVPTDPLPVAPQPVRRSHHHWGRASLHLFKGALLLVEVPIIVVLAGYAGLWHVLPANPPNVQVGGDGHPYSAAMGPYCWFVPGNALCSDALPSSAPLLTVGQGSSLTFGFQSPPPTVCNVNASPNGAMTSTGQTVGSLVGPLGAMSGRTEFRLLIGIAPGAYRLDVSCQWDGPPVLHWLQGQGSAHYTVMVRVLPVPRPSHQLTP